jgi:large subunit ribosomal protein L13
MKTIFSKPIPGNERKWYVVDAKGKNLGRLATMIARMLSGRDRVDYTPHVDNGANIIVINVQHIAVTGTKEVTKMYRSHSQYLGGLKETNLSKMREKNPAHILRHAVSGMLPKNRLQANMIDRLRLITDANHPYDAQKPEAMPVL